MKTPYFITTDSSPLYTSRVCKRALKMSIRGRKQTIKPLSPRPLIVKKMSAGARNNFANLMTHSITLQRLWRRPRARSKGRKTSSHTRGDKGSIFLSPAQESEKGQRASSSRKESRELLYALIIGRADRHGEAATRLSLLCVSPRWFQRAASSSSRSKGF